MSEEFGIEGHRSNSTFIMVYEDVWQVLLGDPHCLAVYMALFRRTYTSNDSWYSTNARMAKESGVGVSTFKSKVIKLRELGLVIVTARWHDPVGNQYSYAKTDVFTDRKGNLYTVRDHLPPAQVGGQQMTDPGQQMADSGPVDDRPPASKWPTPSQQMATDIDPLHRSQTQIPNTSPLAPQGEAAEPSKEIAKTESKKNPTRGARIVTGWMPSQDTIQKMADQFPDMDFFAVHDEFIDYWLGVPGQRGVKLDWDATWRNWVRKAGSRGDYPRTGGMLPATTARRTPSKADQKAGWYMTKAQELAAQFAAEEGNHEA